MKRLWHKITLYLSSNFAAEYTRHIALIPFLFAVGIAIYFALPFEPNIWLSLAAFEVLLFAFYLFRFRNLHKLFLSLILVFCGFLNIQAHTVYKAGQLTDIKAQTVTYLSGQIRDISYNQNGKIRLILHDAADFDNKLKGNFRITLISQPEDLQINQCVELVTTLFPRRPLPILHGFQLDRKYFFDTLSATGYANSEVFTIPCPTPHTTFMSKVNQFRHNIALNISHLLPPEQAGIANAVLIGEKSLISDQISQNYRNSGLAHFLAVSGLHLGTITALVFFVIRFLVALFPPLALRLDSQKIAAVFAILFSGIYLLISGMAIPAQRAFIMTTVILSGILFNRQALSLRMVSFAALLILIISPQALISISFQMSFAAVYTLIAFYEWYCAKFSASEYQAGMFSKIYRYLTGIIVCDLVASLATAPFSLYHFHRLALYTSLGNLLAGPLIGLYLMPMVLLCLVAIPLGLLAYPLQWLGYGIAVLNNITAYVSHLPYSVWYCNSLPHWEFILIILGGFWLCIWQKSWRKLGFLPIISGIIPLFLPAKQPDMIFTPHAEQIALKDKSGNLLMLPLKRNNWLQQTWQENLNVKFPNSLQASGLKATLEGQDISADFALKCNATECVYNTVVKWDFSGNVYLNNQKIDSSAGGNIYLGATPYWLPLWPNQHRLWQAEYK